MGGIRCSAEGQQLAELLSTGAASTAVTSFVHSFRLGLSAGLWTSPKELYTFAQMSHVSIDMHFINCESFSIVSLGIIHICED